MKKLLFFFLLYLLWSPQAWGAVASVTHVAATPATGTTITINITVSGTNPVLVVGIGVEDLSDVATVSSV